MDSANLKALNVLLLNITANSFFQKNKQVNLQTLNKLYGYNNYSR